MSKELDIKHWKHVKSYLILSSSGGLMGRETVFEHKRFPKDFLVRSRAPPWRVSVEESLIKTPEPLVAPGEQVGALHGFLCHRCMNVCVNG